MGASQLRTTVSILFSTLFLLVPGESICVSQESPGDHGKLLLEQLIDEYLAQFNDRGIHSSRLILDGSCAIAQVAAASPVEINAPAVAEYSIVPKQGGRVSIVSRRSKDIAVFSWNSNEHFALATKGDQSFCSIDHIIQSLNLTAPPTWAWPAFLANLRSPVCSIDVTRHEMLDSLLTVEFVLGGAVNFELGMDLADGIQVLWTSEDDGVFERRIDFVNRKLNKVWVPERFEAVRTISENDVTCEFNGQFVEDFQWKRDASIGTRPSIPEKCRVSQSNGIAWIQGSRGEVETSLENLSIEFEDILSEDDGLMMQATPRGTRYRKFMVAGIVIGMITSALLFLWFKRTP